MSNIYVPDKYGNFHKWYPISNRVKRKCIDCKTYINKRRYYDCICDRYFELQSYFEGNTDICPYYTKGQIEDNIQISLL